MEQVIGKLVKNKNTSKRAYIKKPSSSTIKMGDKNSYSTVCEDVDQLMSLENMSLGDSRKEEKNNRTTKPIAVTPNRSAGRSKKGIIKIPTKCLEKFNVDDLTSNNYKALESVIKDILLSNKDKTLAKKSKAKTDLRPKVSTTQGNDANVDSFQERLKGKGAKDIKPKSAQPRSYKNYFRKDKMEEGSLGNKLDVTPQSLDDFNKIYEHAMKKRVTAARKKLGGERRLEKIDETLTLNKAGKLAKQKGND